MKSTMNPKGSKQHGIGHKDRLSDQYIGIKYQVIIHQVYGQSMK